MGILPLPERNSTMTWNGEERRKSGADLSMLLGEMRGELEGIKRTLQDHIGREESQFGEIFPRLNALSVQLEQIKGQAALDTAQAEISKWKVLAAMILGSGGVGAAASKLIEVLK